MKVIFSSYGEFNQDRKIGPARWSHFDLIYIHSGSIDIFLKEELPIKIINGQAILIFPDTLFRGHSTTSSSRASVHHFEFPDANVWPAQTFYQRRNGCALLDGRGNLDIARDLDRSLRLPAHLSADAANSMQGHLLGLALAQLQYNTSASPQPEDRKHELQSLLDWLEHNVDRSIAPAEMADRINLSESHFRKIFRHQYGVSPAQHHQKLRMTHACRLLRESNLPVKAIANELGYDDLAHFYRAFGRFTSIPPGSYRKLHSPRG